VYLWPCQPLTWHVLGLTAWLFVIDTLRSGKQSVRAVLLASLPNTRSLVFTSDVSSDSYADVSFCRVDPFQTRMAQPAFAFSTSLRTTATSCLKASISSSTLPPFPADEKLTELPTCTCNPVLLANVLARRSAKSRLDGSVYRGVLSGAEGL
jgi:hypothetical protein